MTVDKYNSEDWQKLKAAVSALKNPVLDESVLLEPSVVGQYLHSDYIRSQSTPNIAELTEEEFETLHNGKDSHFHYQSPIPINGYHTRENGNGNIQHRKISEGGIYGNLHLNDPTDPNLGMVNDWVATTLPEYGRRVRSHTEPTLPPNYILEKDSNLNSKAMTLPHHHVRSDSSIAAINAASKVVTVVQNVDKEPELSPAVEANSPKHPPIVSTPKKISIQSSSPSATPERRSHSSQTASPMSSSTTPKSKLVKIYMNKVQKGIVINAHHTGSSYS